MIALKVQTANRDRSWRALAMDSGHQCQAMEPISNVVPDAVRRNFWDIHRRMGDLCNGQKNGQKNGPGNGPENNQSEATEEEMILMRAALWNASGWLRRCESLNAALLALSEGGTD